MGVMCRWQILLLSSFFLVVLFSTFYQTFGFPEQSRDCSICHDNPSGMATTASSTYFELNKSETYILNISATLILGGFLIAAYAEREARLETEVSVN